MTQLQAGDMAPDFKSTTQDGAALTLAGLYLGYKVFGFFGIILTPLALIMVKLLNDHHYICLWK